LNEESILPLPREGTNDYVSQPLVRINHNFVNSKIIEADQDISSKIHILDKLLGKYKEASKIKEKFMKMYIV